MKIRGKGRSSPTKTFGRAEIMEILSKGIVAIWEDYTPGEYLRETLEKMWTRGGGNPACLKDERRRRIEAYLGERGLNLRKMVLTGNCWPKQVFYITGECEIDRPRDFLAKQEAQKAKAAESVA